MYKQTFTASNNLCKVQKVIHKFKRSSQHFFFKNMSFQNSITMP